MNDLYPFGIQNEQSDLRAHVCPLVRRVYVYPTAEGRKAIASASWPRRAAFQPGVEGPTAEGYLVQPFAIRRCVSLEFSRAAWDTVALKEDEGTSIKGQKAVCLVAGMIRNGVFPLPYSVEGLNANPDKIMQIKGDDIILALGAVQVHIQVKCDFRGGDKGLGGTGNLFLQIAERNPLKRI